MITPTSKVKLEKIITKIGLAVNAPIADISAKQIEYNPTYFWDDPNLYWDDVNITWYEGLIRVEGNPTTRIKGLKPSTLSKSITSHLRIQ